MSAAVIHPERAAAYARGDLAERMVGVACALACEVRDEGAEAVGAFLDTLSPDEVRALLVVAAAMIPVDVAPADLLAWVTWDEFGSPLPGTQPSPAPAAAVRDVAAERLYEDCGTMRAFWRHQKAGHSRETVEACGCAQASRDYYVRRYAARVGPRRPGAGGGAEVGPGRAGRALRGAAPGRVQQARGGGRARRLGAHDPPVRRPAGGARCSLTGHAMASPITEPGWYRARPGGGLERVAGLDGQPDDVTDLVKVEVDPQLTEEPLF